MVAGRTGVGPRPSRRIGAGRLEDASRPGVDDGGSAGASRTRPAAGKDPVLRANGPRQVQRRSGRGPFRAGSGFIGARRSRIDGPASYRLPGQSVEKA
ncbi:hypothetical protein B4N89_44865 [Embleya scabrispora]|uniref:Uncharacterized protein n=1 Tax=Embleya scabrispora TaxID=159449 RepID=A0A1T3NIF3_9ACTN|nr:hypothetical protein B4N89_44865 [Embleya scabrispora]